MSKVALNVRNREKHVSLHIPVSEVLHHGFKKMISDLYSSGRCIFISWILFSHLWLLKIFISMMKWITEAEGVSLSIRGKGS